MKKHMLPAAVLVLCALISFSMVGCASFSTAIRPVEVEGRSQPAVPLKVGIREASVGDVGSGTFLIANQPAVGKALSKTEEVKVDFTKAFTDYCREANLFEGCVGVPFDISQVDLELQPRLKRLKSRDNYGGWLLANMATLDIPALFGWPYKNEADCTVEADVRSADGKIDKTYFGAGQGVKKTNLYALIFGLREVPHAMLAVNRCVTTAFDAMGEQIIADTEYLNQARSGGEQK
jgi:hypothetical protein